MNTFIVRADTQEKRALIHFPDYYRLGPQMVKVATERYTFEKGGGGDYALHPKHWDEGYWKVGIEQKCQPAELYACFLGQDRSRCDAQLAGLAARYDRPYLLISSTPAELMYHNWRMIDRNLPDWTADLIMQQIALKCATHGVSLVWSQRIDAGIRETMLARIVLSLLLTPKIPTNS